MPKPEASTSLAKRELDSAEAQFKEFDDNIKSLTMDRMNKAPKEETAPQTELSQKAIEKSTDIYLKPVRTIGRGAKDKFNEKFREAYNFDKEYVHFVAENKEIIGDTIDMWTGPYPGMSVEQWQIPVNTPVWAPRYVAEQIKRKSYHRLVMKETVTQTTGAGQFYGQMAADTTIQRLDAHPVNSKKSIFMSAAGF
jgi:hypothetical protein